MPKEKDEPVDKSVMIFGRDVSVMPCFRNSFLYGTLGGLTFGLTHFLFTSKVGKSANYSVYAFSLITMGYWVQCRYQYSKAKFEMTKMQVMLRERALHEGTSDDPFKEPHLEAVDV